MLQTFNQLGRNCKQALIIYSLIAIYDASAGEPVYHEYFPVRRRWCCIPSEVFPCSVISSNTVLLFLIQAQMLSFIPEFPRSNNFKLMSLGFLQKFLKELELPLEKNIEQKNGTAEPSFGLQCHFLTYCCKIMDELPDSRPLLICAGSSALAGKCQIYHLKGSKTL